MSLLGDWRCNTFKSILFQPKMINNSQIGIQRRLGQQWSYFERTEKYWVSVVLVTCKTVQVNCFAADNDKPLPNRYT
jgi:hypothetical protein